MLKDKVILITGSTDGLGRAVARQAAHSGATVLLHGRNSEKGNRLLEELSSTTGNPNLFYYNADLASLEEVRDFSSEVLSRHDALHVLINNAAIGGGPRGSRSRELSRDGLELRFQVNYLSHFLLTQNLLPLLLESPHARVVHVASIGQSPLNFSDLMMEKGYQSFEAYCRSKLAQIMYGFQLSEALQWDGVCVNSLHPASLMDTNMVHEFFGRTSSRVADGAAVVEYVAFSPELNGVTGRYFNQFQPARAHSQAYDEGARKQLWKMSTDLVKPYLL